MSLILLILLGPFLVVAPGALLTVLQFPELLDRRPQATPVVRSRPVARSRWAVA